MNPPLPRSRDRHPTAQWLAKLAAEQAEHARYADAHVVSYNARPTR